MVQAAAGPPVTHKHVEPIVWIVTAAIVMVDVWLPPGYAIGVLVVGVVLAGLWIPRRAFLLQYAVIVTVLELVGLLVHSTDGGRTMALFNHGMSIGALWITAAGIALYHRASAARLAAEARVREQAALAELGKMAAAVAHEVRNALTGIGASLQTMYDASSRQVWDEDIRAQVMQRLSDLGDSITDLVVFAETKPPVMAPVSLPELVAEAVTLASTRPTCAHVAVRTDVPQTSVNVDREQLRRVLFNLIVNGAQAMQGQGEIAIRADVSRNRWQLEVIDNGPGISPAVRARLFEPFFSTKNHGVGLGLAFAKRVVQSHGGTIDFRFPPGGGAAAVLSLPT